MTKARKILRKTLFFILMTVIVLISSGVLAVWLYGDQIKARIIANLNTQINTPVQVSKIDLNIFDNFPNLTISLKKVFVKESIEFSDNPLLKAEKVNLILSPLKLIRGDYSINSIAIFKGNLNLLINRKGKVNYLIFKKNEANPTADPYFKIEKLYLHDLAVNYKDINAKQDIDITAKDMFASIQLSKSVYEINYKGDTQIGFIQIGDTRYLEGREAWSAGKINYYASLNKVDILSSKVKVQNSDFLVSGFYDMGDDGKINIKMDGDNTTIQNLISLLPENTANSLSDYNSQGDVYFDLELSGKLNAKTSPAISIHFGCKNTTITHPGSSKAIVNTSFEGFYISNALDDYRSAVLSLSGLEGNFDNRPFSGSLTIRNFEDKEVKLVLLTSIQLESVLEFFPNEYITNGMGMLNVDIAFNGRLKDLESTSTINRVSSKGQIELEQVSLGIKSFQKPFNELNGVFLFGEQNIALNQVRGYLGNSQFELNGILINMLPYLFAEKKKFIIDAKLQSDFIDLDELLSIGYVEEKKEKETSTYSLNIPPELVLNFDCKINRLEFRRFNGRKISGLLNIKDQMVMFHNLKFQDAGGSVLLEGFVDTGGETIEVLTRFELDKINLDSMFYIFEDFNQDWLTHHHLSGKMTSTVTADMSFTRSLEFIPQSLIADMNVAIKGGELKNFEPMLLLDPYLPKDNLKHFRFSDLTNDIHIEDQTVYLPQMQINSNVTNILIGGTHTFDQHIHYKIVAPIINTPKIDKDEMFGAIEDDGTNVPRIHLLLTGTTDDYKISLDKQGTKNQVISDLKNEVKELKEAFQNKQKEKKKALKLEEDEYFDWDY